MDSVRTFSVMYAVHRLSQSSAFLRTVCCYHVTTQIWVRILGKSVYCMTIFHSSVQLQKSPTQDISKSGRQSGDCSIWPLKSSSEIHVSMYGLTYSLYSPPPPPSKWSQCKQSLRPCVCSIWVQSFPVPIYQSSTVQLCSSYQSWGSYKCLCFGWQIKLDPSHMDTTLYRGQRM